MKNIYFMIFWKHLQYLCVLAFLLQIIIINTVQNLKRQIKEKLGMIIILY